MLISSQLPVPFSCPLSHLLPLLPYPSFLVFLPPPPATPPTAHVFRTLPCRFPVPPLLWLRFPRSGLSNSFPRLSTGRMLAIGRVRGMRRRHPYRVATPLTSAFRTGPYPRRSAPGAATRQRGRTPMFHTLKIRTRGGGSTGAGARTEHVHQAAAATTL